MNLIQDTPENRIKIREVADWLAGTCQSLDSALQMVFQDDELTIENISVELMQELDDQVMECQDCNYWCETSLMDDNQTCDDCGGEA